jgi:hypothetical protein
VLSRLKRVPSPALVISVIALIVAVGGGSFALAISDKKSDKKIANAVVTKRAPRLSVKHAKTAGHAGTADNASTLGGLGSSAYLQGANLVVRTDTVDVGAGFAFGKTVQCATGEHATGGGISDPGTNANSRVTTSYPVNSSGDPVTAGNQPTGWHAQAFNANGSGTITYTIYAVCVK